MLDAAASWPSLALGARRALSQELSPGMGRRERGEIPRDQELWGSWQEKKRSEGRGEVGGGWGR